MDMDSAFDRAQDRMRWSAQRWSDRYNATVTILDNSKRPDPTPAVIESRKSDGRNFLNDDIKSSADSKALSVKDEQVRKSARFETKSWSRGQHCQTDSPLEQRDKIYSTLKESSSTEGQNKKIDIDAPPAAVVIDAKKDEVDDDDEEDDYTWTEYSESDEGEQDALEAEISVQEDIPKLEVEEKVVEKVQVQIEPKQIQTVFQAAPKLSPITFQVNKSYL